MSTTMHFLETLGQNSQLRHAGKPALYTTLSQHAVDQAAQWAILGGDSARLEVLLGARKNLVCGLTPGKDREDEQESPARDDDEEIGTRGHGASRAA